MFPKNVFSTKIIHSNILFDANRLSINATYHNILYCVVRETI